MKTPDFVYFDLGNVLFTFSGGLDELAKRNHKPKADFERVFLKYDGEMCRGNLTPQEMLGKYESELNLETQNINFADFWTNHFFRIQETIDLLHKLEKAEIPVGIISNIYLEVFGLITQKDILPKVSWKAKILSCDIGIVKPEDKIYRIAEEASMTNPENILFIDDKAEFLAPAQRRGWQTHQFDVKNPSNSVAEIKTILQLA